MTDSGEQQTISESSTGGLKQVKLERFDLIPIDALTQLARHYGEGAKKYDNNQWRKGYEWSKSYAALMRHATQFWEGEDFDEETGSNHMAAVAWHAFTLLTFFKDFPEYDDRFSTVGIPNSDKDNRWTNEDVERLPSIFGYGDRTPTVRDVVEFARESDRNWTGKSMGFFWNALNRFRMNNPGPGYGSAKQAFTMACDAGDIHNGSFEDAPIGSFVWSVYNEWGNLALKINSRDVLAIDWFGNAKPITFAGWTNGNLYAGWSRVLPGYEELV
jgi:hypothetical protein